MQLSAGFKLLYTAPDVDQVQASKGGGTKSIWCTAYSPTSDACSDAASKVYTQEEEEGHLIETSGEDVAHLWRPKTP